MHELLNAPFAGEESLFSCKLFEIRCPYSICVSGRWLLSQSGVIMQILLRNPLADPFILGVSGGAAVGANCNLLAAAYSGFTRTPSVAPLSIFLVFTLANAGKRWSVTRLLLTGVVVSRMGCINQSSAYNQQRKHRSEYAARADRFARRASWHSYALLVAGLGGGAYGRALNVLTQGDQNAQLSG